MVCSSTLHIQKRECLQPLQKVVKRREIAIKWLIQPRQAGVCLDRIKRALAETIGHCAHSGDSEPLEMDLPNTTWTV